MRLHVEPVRDARFAPRGAVENPLAEQAVEPVGGETTPTHSGGDNDCPRIQDLLVVEHDASRVSIEAHNFARNENLSA